MIPLKVMGFLIKLAKFQIIINKADYLLKKNKKKSKHLCNSHNNFSLNNRYNNFKIIIIIINSYNNSKTNLWIIIFWQNKCSKIIQYQYLINFSNQTQFFDTHLQLIIIIFWKDEYPIKINIITYHFFLFISVMMLSYKYFTFYFIIILLVWS